MDENENQGDPVIPQDSKNPFAILSDELNVNIANVNENGGKSHHVYQNMPLNLYDIIRKNYVRESLGQYQNYIADDNSIRKAYLETFIMLTEQYEGDLKEGIIDEIRTLNETCDKKLIDNPHYKWYVNKVLPQLIEDSRKQGPKGPKQSLVSRSLFQFMQEKKKYNEREKFEKDDWKSLLNLMRKNLIDIDEEDQDYDQQSDGGPPFKTYFQEVEGEGKINIIQVHQILTAFFDDEKSDHVFEQLLRKTVESLLEAASPQIYKYRFGQNSFVSIALAYYIDAKGGLLIQAMLNY